MSPHTAHDRQRWLLCRAAVDPVLGPMKVLGAQLLSLPFPCWKLLGRVRWGPLGMAEPMPTE